MSWFCVVDTESETLGIVSDNDYDKEASFPDIEDHVVCNQQQNEVQLANIKKSLWQEMSLYPFFILLNVI